MCSKPPETFHFGSGGLGGSMFKNELSSPKDKLLALKLIKECDEAKFALFKDGPSIMNLKALEERVNKIESGQIN